MSSRPKKGASAKAVAKEEPAKAQDEISLKKERLTKEILAIAERAPPMIKPYTEKAAPFVAIAIVYMQIAWPYILEACSKAVDFYNKLPENARHVVIGFVMCFFGGVFPAIIAAYEAWSQCGGAEATEDAKKLYQQFNKAKEAIEEDDKKDDDGNGIADVDELSPEQLLERKAAVVAKAVDPQELSNAVTGLWMAWIGVLAVLKIQFAKAVTLGAAIGQALYKSASTYIEPHIKAMITDEDKHKWVPVITKWICKGIAISIAWWVQRIISAFHSALRGGLLFGRGLVNLANEKGLIKFDDKSSYLDEGVGYALAVVGFIFQFSSGFSLFFPLNILFLPLRMLEGYIVWSVSS